jgi:uncharacterized membrane protein
MKFFCDVAFMRKLLIIIFLVIIIILLIVGRFRTMRVKMVGKEVLRHTLMHCERGTHLHGG